MIQRFVNKYVYMSKGEFIWEWIKIFAIKKEYDKMEWILGWEMAGFGNSCIILVYISAVYHVYVI